MSNRGSFGVTARNGIFSEIRRLVSVPATSTTTFTQSRKLSATPRLLPPRATIGARHLPRDRIGGYAYCHAPPREFAGETRLACQRIWHLTASLPSRRRNRRFFHEESRLPQESFPGIFEHLLMYR